MISYYVGGKTTLRLLQGLIFGLILTEGASATAEESSGKGPIVSTLDQISARLVKDNCVIVIVVSLVFGLIFLYQGVDGLLQ